MLLRVANSPAPTAGVFIARQGKRPLVNARLLVYVEGMARILIVEDDADSCMPLATFLRSKGYEVDCLPNGKEALVAVIAQTPDLIILDLFMPEMDGAGLLEIMRSYLRLQSLPVILWTGLPDSPLVERARHLKVNDVLVKSKATFDDILNAVEMALVRAPG